MSLRDEDISRQAAVEQAKRIQRNFEAGGMKHIFQALPASGIRRGPTTDGPRGFQPTGTNAANSFRRGATVDGSRGFQPTGVPTHGGGNPRRSTPRIHSVAARRLMVAVGFNPRGFNPRFQPTGGVNPRGSTPRIHSVAARRLMVAVGFNPRGFQPTGVPTHGGFNPRGSTPRIHSVAVLHPMRDARASRIGSG